MTADQIATPQEVLDFWFGEPGSADHGHSRSQWFVKDAQFDAEVRRCFLPTVEAAERGTLSRWAADDRSPATVLAFVLVCDQFPRNLFRGEPRAFALDQQALAAASRLVARVGDLELLPVQRWFLYLPFEHSESRIDQQESLRLFGQLRDDPVAGGAWEWAVKHAQVIEEFGRFPHRNAVLGRQSTPAEVKFLRQPGSRF